MELVGRSFSYWVSLRGATWLWVSVREMDNAAADPDIFFNRRRWSERVGLASRRFIAALERSGLASLKERPIHIGAGEGPDSFIIA